MINILNIESFGLVKTKNKGGRPKKKPECDCGNVATERLYSTDQMCCKNCLRLEKLQAEENKANGSGLVREKRADRRAAEAEDGVGWSDLTILKAALHAWELRNGFDPDASIDL